MNRKFCHQFAIRFFGDFPDNDIEMSFTGIWVYGMVFNCEELVWSVKGYGGAEKNICFLNQYHPSYCFILKH